MTDVGIRGKNFKVVLISIITLSYYTENEQMGSLRKEIKTLKGPNGNSKTKLNILDLKV